MPTDEESQDIELLRILAFAHAKSQYRPEHLHCRDPVARWNFGQNNVRGQFANDIADSPKGLHVVELVVVQA